MSFGLETFTIVHVLLSLVGIGSGLAVLYGMLTAKTFERWTALFLATTGATSVTGFLFPVHHFLPSHGVGIISLILLAIAIPSRYRFQLAGPWRRTFVITALTALCLNVFVLIVQLFLKVPALKAASPTQSEPPFLVAQTFALLLFVALIVRAAMKFRIGPLAIGRLVIRRVLIESAELKSLAIQGLTVTRLRAAEVTVDDSLTLPDRETA